MSKIIFAKKKKQTKGNYSYLRRILGGWTNYNLTKQ